MIAIAWSLFGLMAAALGVLSTVLLSGLSRFDGVNTRLDGLGGRIDSGLDGLGGRIDGLHTRIDDLNARVDGLGEHLGNRIDALGERLTRAGG